MKATMHYLQHHAKDPAQPLTLSTTAIPEPADDQVLVRVKAFGVNRADLLQRAGHYPPPPGESEILGLEICGEICQLGCKVTTWQLGQRVCAIVGGGGYAEYAVVNADHLIALPDSVSDAQGAGLSEIFLTAYQALKWVSGVQPQQKALIHAGASGVGLAAIQLCASWDIACAATASSAAKLAQCEQAGAALLINYKQQDFASEIKAHWPQGVNMVLDMVAGDYLNRNLRVLATDGTIVYLAMMAGRYADNLDMALLLGKRASIKGSTLRNQDAAYKAKLVSAFCRDCYQNLSSGALKVPIDSVLPVAQIEQAHQRMQANQTQGKLIVEW